MHKTAWVIGVVLLFGCEGPAGEMGAMGETGDRGETGDMGEIGERGDPGPAGDAGPRGAQGRPGPQGEEGEGFGALVESSSLCQAISGGWLLGHRITRFADGSVIGACTINTRQQTSSETVVFVDAQVGAAAAACNVTHDAEQDGTAGYWRFAHDGTASTATYVDNGSPMDGDVIILDDCVTVP